MDKKEIEKRAFELFYPATGFNCAESISKTIVEFFGDGNADNIPKVASGFGGGIGHTIADTCGILTGGVVALSHLFGRMTPEENNDKLYEMVTEYRDKFIRENGSTNCTVLLEGLGKQDDMIKCRNMTERAAGIIAEIIKNGG